MGSVSWLPRPPSLGHPTTVTPLRGAPTAPNRGRCVSHRGSLWRELSARGDSWSSVGFQDAGPEPSLMDFGAPGPGSRGQTTRDSGRGQARGALRTPTQPQRGSQDHGQVPLSGLHSLESGLGGQSVLLRVPCQAAPGPGAWTATCRRVGPRSGAEPVLTSTLASARWALGARGLGGMPWLLSVLGC